MREFYGCYLLVSKAPQAKGRTYIGFTVNPRRRIRQHNGLITAGAWKTSRYRPWEMTLVLYGFPTKVQALQFEWAWQNPQRSITVRPIAEALGARKMAGVRGKILLMLSMLHESPWRYFPLTLQYLQPEFAEMVKETVISAPVHVRVFTAPLDQVPKAINDVGDEESGDDEERGASGGEGSGDGEPLQVAPDENPPQASLPRSGVLASSHTCSAAGPAAAAATSSGTGQTCHICRSVIERHSVFCAACRVTFHLECLATRWVNTERAGAEEAGGVQDRNRFGGVPEQGHCPACSTLHSWMGMLQSVHTIGWGNKRRGRRGRKVQTVDKAAPSPNAETELYAQEPALVAKGRKRTAKAPKAAATTALDLPSHLEPLAGVAEPSLGASTACGQLVGAAAVKGKAAGRKGRTANPGGAGAGCELVTEQLADGGADVDESALQQAGAKKRAAKPRAPRRKAGVATAAGVGGTVSDGAGSLGPTATTVELAPASGIAAEVGGKLIESPPKRPRQVRRVPARPQDPQLQQDSPKPSASPPQGAFPCPIRNTDEQGLLRTCDATQVKEDTSPIPLWRRLQTRAVGATTTAVTTAVTSDLPAVPVWHSQGACLGSASYSIISSEDVEDADEPPGEPSATCLVGQDDPAVATTHRRAMIAAGGVFIIDASSSDEPDTVDEDSDESHGNTDSDKGVEVLGDPLQPANAGSSLGVCLKSLGSGQSPGAYAITPQQPHEPSSCAAASPQSSPLDRQPAPSSPDVLLAVRPPPASSQGSPPPSPMDASPGLQHRAAVPTTSEAAASPTRTPRMTLPATQPFGSPAWCLPVSDSSPASASDRAGGSAGGAVTALMSQLRCSGCTSPPGNQTTSSCLAPTPLGGVACAAAAATAAAESYRALQQDSDCLGAERLAAAPSVSVASPAAEHGAAQTGRAARVLPSQCTTHTEALHKGPLRQTVVADVVDLCSPLPLSSRLARRVGFAGALGQVGSGLVGKRLRSPKLPTRLPACGAASDGGVSKHGAAEGRTHGLLLANRSFAASAGTAIQDTTRGAHHSTAAAGAGHAGQAAAVLRPLPEEPEATGSWSVSPWPIRQRCERGRHVGNSGLQEGAAEEGEEPDAGDCLQERTRGLELEDPDLGVLMSVDAGDGGVAGALRDKILREGSVLECRGGAGQRAVCASSDDDVIIID